MYVGNCYVHHQVHDGVHKYFLAIEVGELIYKNFGNWRKKIWEKMHFFWELQIFEFVDDSTRKTWHRSKPRSSFQCLHCDVTNDVTCSKINNFSMIDSYRRFLKEYGDLWSRALAVAPVICAGRDQDANELLIDVFVNAVRADVTQTNRKRRAARLSGSATYVIEVQ